MRVLIIEQAFSFKLEEVHMLKSWLENKLARDTEESEHSVQDYHSFVCQQSKEKLGDIKRYLPRVALSETSVSKKGGVKGRSGHQQQELSNMEAGSSTGGQQNHQWRGPPTPEHHPRSSNLAWAKSNQSMHSNADTSQAAKLSNNYKRFPMHKANLSLKVQV
jgi:hypothetical protein